MASDFHHPCNCRGLPIAAGIVSQARSETHLPAPRFGSGARKGGRSGLAAPVHALVRMRSLMLGASAGARSRSCCLRDGWRRLRSGDPCARDARTAAPRATGSRECREHAACSGCARPRDALEELARGHRRVAPRWRPTRWFAAPRERSRCAACSTAPIAEFDIEHHRAAATISRRTRRRVVSHRCRIVQRNQDMQ